jgi:hypothetical protein
MALGVLTAGIGTFALTLICLTAGGAVAATAVDHDSKVTSDLLYQQCLRIFNRYLIDLGDETGLFLRQKPITT